MIFKKKYLNMSDTGKTPLRPSADQGGDEPKMPINFDTLPEDISMKIRAGGKIRRIVVDREACIGAQSCVVVAPGVFQMDDGNLAYVTDPDGEDEDTVMLGAQSCPVLAIHLYDEDGVQIFPEE